MPNAELSIGSCQKIAVCVYPEFAGVSRWSEPHPFSYKRAKMNCRFVKFAGELTGEVADPRTPAPGQWIHLLRGFRSFVVSGSCSIGCAVLSRWYGRDLIPVDALHTEH